MIRGILIDPCERNVRDVEVDESHYTNIYEVIGASPFTVVELSPSEVMYLDDEGMLRDDPRFFTLAGNGPFAGKALILGTTEDGNMASTRLSTSRVGSLVKWKNIKIVGWTEGGVKENQPMPWGGTGTVFEAGRPIFKEENDDVGH